MSKRKGTPNTTYTYNDAVVGRVVLVADDTGAIDITTDAERRIADQMRLGTVRPHSKPAARAAKEV